MTLYIMTLMMTFSMMTFNMMTFSMMSFSMMTFRIILNKTRHSSQWQSIVMLTVIYAECHI
jgi:hypothetical protein